MTKLSILAAGVLGTLAIVASAAHATQPTRESGPPRSQILEAPASPEPSQRRHETVTNPRGSTVPGTESAESAARAGIGQQSVGTSRDASGGQTQDTDDTRQQESSGATHSKGTGTGASGSGGSGNVLQSDVPRPQR